MHELSIAASLVEMVEEEAESRGVRVLAVHLKLGALSGVVKNALAGSYEIASAGTSLQGSRLLIEEVPLTVFCPLCDKHRHPRSIQLLECPECHTPTPHVLEGTELQVYALEVEP
jgi:hydrogenase nickel incorporation protein HypA/HybF